MNLIKIQIPYPHFGSSGSEDDPKTSDPDEPNRLAPQGNTSTINPIKFRSCVLALALRVQRTTREQDPD